MSAPPLEQRAPALEIVGSLAAAREAWEALEGGCGRIFSTWEWADAWWRVNGAGRRLVIGVLRTADGAPVAVLPTYRADRGPLRLLRLLGHGVAGELGLVCAPEDAPAAAGILRRLARDEIGPRGVLLLDRMRGDDPAVPALDAGVVRQESTPLLSRDGRTWEEWLATRSSNFRSQVRRRERALLRDHALRYRLAEDPDRLDADIDLLLALHRARWADGGSSAFTPGREAFHRDFARRALARGWLRLWFAELDGVPVAAWHGFRFAGSEWYFQAGREPDWERSNVGFVLLAHTIRAAFEDGVEVYRFGVGEEGYKDRFATEDPGLRSLVAGVRPVERAASVVAAGVRRLPPGLRRAVTRRAG